MAVEEDLAIECTRALERTVEMARSSGYNPSYFTQMLDTIGGIETAKRLLASKKPQIGLFKLYDLDLLDESMEAVVLQERFQCLFTDGELKEAHKRLEDLNYFE